MVIHQHVAMHLHTMHLDHRFQKRKKMTAVTIIPKYLMAVMTTRGHMVPTANYIITQRATHYHDLDETENIVNAILYYV
jgi:hypothetical protein